MRHYVLVGTGIAALSAPEALRETDPRGRITMVSIEPHQFTFPAMTSPHSSKWARLTHRSREPPSDSVPDHLP